MALTFDEAYTIITDRLISEWTAGAPVIVGTVPELRFEDVEKKDVPTATFGRFVMNQVSGPQGSIRNGEFGQRYENNGIIIVQLLIKRVDETDASIARKLSQLVVDIFRDPAFPGCFIFQNTRVQRLEPEPSFLRRNIVTEYQFDELA